MIAGSERKQLAEAGDLSIRDPRGVSACGGAFRPAGQGLHVRHLAPAQGAGAAVEDGQCFGLGGVASV